MARDIMKKKRTRLIYLKKQHRDLDDGIITAYNMHTKDNIVETRENITIPFLPIYIMTKKYIIKQGEKFKGRL